MTELVRRADWEARLTAFVRARRAMPFAWRANDCCLFAADAVLAMTDVDLAAPYRGYTGVREALRIIKGAGGSLRNLVPLPEKPVALAERGDLALLIIGKREFMALVCNPGIVCGPSPTGIVARSMSNAVAAFAV